MKLIWGILVYSLLGTTLTLSGIAGFILALLYLKCDTEGLIAILAVGVTAFGIFDIVATYDARHYLDHWMD